MSLHSHKLSSRRLSAFTLVELLIVIVIVGLLATLATTSYLRAQTNARDNARKTDISSISAAVETYYSVNKSFPGGTACHGTTTLYYYTPTACTGTAFAPAPAWIPNLATYLSPFPTEKRYADKDGKKTDSYATVLAAKDSSATNKTRTYVYENLGKGYAAYARLENTTTGDNIYSSGNLDCPTGVTAPAVSGENIYALCK